MTVNFAGMNKGRQNVCKISLIDKCDPEVFWRPGLWESESTRDGRPQQDYNHTNVGELYAPAKRQQKDCSRAMGVIISKNWKSRCWGGEISHSSSIPPASDESWPDSWCMRWAWGCHCRAGIRASEEVEGWEVTDRWWHSNLKMFCVIKFNYSAKDVVICHKVSVTKVFLLFVDNFKVQTHNLLSLIA